MDKRTGQDPETPVAQRSEPETEERDFSPRKASAGISLRSNAANAAVDLDLFGEVRAQVPRSATPTIRAAQARRKPHPEPDQPQLDVILPFTNPLPIRQLGGSPLPDAIRGPRHEIEAKAAAMMAEAGLDDTTLADILPPTRQDHLRVFRLTFCNFDLEIGPRLQVASIVKDARSLQLESPVWAALAQANVGETIDLRDGRLLVCSRGVILFFPMRQEVYFFSLRRKLLDDALLYYENQAEIQDGLARVAPLFEHENDFVAAIFDRGRHEQITAGAAQAREAIRGLHEQFPSRPLHPPFRWI